MGYPAVPYRSVPGVISGTVVGSAAPGLSIPGFGDVLTVTHIVAAIVYLRLTASATVEV